VLSLRKYVYIQKQVALKKKKYSYKKRKYCMTDGFLLWKQTNKQTFILQSITACCCDLSLIIYLQTRIQSFSSFDITL